MRVALVILLELIALPALADPGADPWNAPQFSVGDQVSAEVKLSPRIAGFDLPDLDETEGYMRGDETIYCVDRATLKVLKIIPIGSVLLH